MIYKCYKIFLPMDCCFFSSSMFCFFLLQDGVQMIRYLRVSLVMPSYFTGMEDTNLGKSQAHTANSGRDGSFQTPQESSRSTNCDPQLTSPRLFTSWYIAEDNKEYLCLKYTCHERDCHCRSPSENAIVSWLLS